MLLRCGLTTDAGLFMSSSMSVAVNRAARTFDDAPAALTLPAAPEPAPVAPGLEADEAAGGNSGRAPSLAATSALLATSGGSTNKMNRRVTLVGQPKVTATVTTGSSMTKLVETLAVNCVAPMGPSLEILTAPGASLLSPEKTSAPTHSGVIPSSGSELTLTEKFKGWPSVEPSTPFPRFNAQAEALDILNISARAIDRTVRCMRYKSLNRRDSSMQATLVFKGKLPVRPRPRDGILNQSKPS